jgi:VCBS repeat protein
MKHVRCGVGGALVGCILLVGQSLAKSAESPKEFKSDVFRKPVLLQADGKPIDTGEVWGHSGPTIADVDGDGPRDLIVGDFSGKFRLFRNTASNESPVYKAAGYVMAKDKPAEVWIYCCIGSSPQFVDFDGDGKQDLISGSYDPGECYLFRGVGDGKFAERETVKGADGKPVLRVPDQQQKVQSFGSWPVMVDWDDDGDLDLLVGGFDGTMFVRINEGSPKEPKLSAKNLPVTLDGKELKTPAAHAAVAVADWDGDGRWDIVSGCETGAVYWYRNIGEKGSPRFAAEQRLVPDHDGSGYDELRESGAEPIPGIRSQVAVADYNNDGKPDLILGDFCTVLTLRPDLTEKDRKEIAAIRKQIEETGKVWGDAFKALQKEFEKEFPGDKALTKEAGEVWSKRYLKLKNGDDYKQMDKKRAELEKKLGEYMVRPEKPGSFNESATTHGYVWLYLRK